MANSLQGRARRRQKRFSPAHNARRGRLRRRFRLRNPDVVETLLSRVQTVELGELKIALGEQAFKINPALQAKHLTADAQSKLTKLAVDLGPREVDRLLHLPEVEQASQGDRYLHCEFERSTAQMRYFSAVDHGLAERALVARSPRAPISRPRRRRRRASAAPSRCYQMELTDDGYDVKSLIVSEMTRFFHGGFDAEFEKGRRARRREIRRRRQVARQGRPRGKGERVAAR